MQLTVKYIRKAKVTEIGGVTLEGATIEEIEEKARKLQFKAFLPTERIFEDEEWDFLPLEAEQNNDAAEV